MPESFSLIRRYKAFKLLLFVLLVCYGTANAQQDSTYTNNMRYVFNSEVQLSGFGGPSISFSEINEELAVSTGGYGAILFDSRYFIGGYGEGVTSTVDVELDGGFSAKLDFGHGGLLFGKIFYPNKMLHFGLSSKVGLGGIAVNDESPFVFPQIISIDNVWVLAPQLELEANMAKWLKINIGLGYRRVYGIDVSFLENSQFDSPTATIGLSMGWFRSK